MAAPPSPPRCSRRSRRSPSVDAAAGSLQDLQNNSNPAKLLDTRRRDHRPPGRDDGRRHRRLRPPVLPAQAQAGRVGARRRRDRPRRRHGVQAGLRGRRHDPGGRHRPGEALQDHGRRDASARSTRSAAPRSPIFDLPTAQKLFEKEGQYDSISVKATDGVSPDALTKEIKPLLPASRRRQDRRRPGRGRLQGHQREPEVHHVLPARLRRHRAVRRRVRDPQHALDHRRPALARVRDAAHARRLAAPGHALGRARRARRRPPRVRARARCSGSGSPRA